MFASCLCYLCRYNLCKLKNPSDFADFPRSDVYVATGDDFSMIIDLTAVNEESGVTESMVATFVYNEKEYNLSVSCSGSHGTIFVPTASSQILSFESEDVNEKIHFSVRKYAFNKNDFFLLDIYLFDDHNLPCLAPGMNLHFFKQTNADDLTFMIDYFGFEDVHQETISLKNITYTSSYYKADISGTLILSKTPEAQTYKIQEQSITFNQVFGHIWQASIVAENLTEPIDIFASRADENPTRSSKEIVCDERTVTALEIQNYSNIKYLFINDVDYLIYQ